MIFLPVFEFNYLLLNLDLKYFYTFSHPNNDPSKLYTPKTLFVDGFLLFITVKIELYENKINIIYYNLDYLRIIYYY